MASNKHLGALAYIGTWLALLALTGLTFGLSFASLGAWELPVAILIAGTKSLLVALLFMHLAEQGTTARTIAVVAIAFVTLLCALTILDASVRADEKAFEFDPSLPD